MRSVSELKSLLAPRSDSRTARILRYRDLRVREAVRRKNKTAGLLMAVGAPYHKQRRHAKSYFYPLRDELADTPPSVRRLLLSRRRQLELFQKLAGSLLAGVRRHPRLPERVARRETIDGVGAVLALSWALEVGDPERFASIRQAVSSRGLCRRRSSRGARHNAVRCRSKATSICRGC